MVDDIELAQFVYYLSNHKKMRDALNILNDKGVLLLGRFKDGRLERLYRMRDSFEGKGYRAMMFDFARPDNLSLTETVVATAGWSKFVVADLSGSSVLAELESIFTEIKKPVLAFGDPYALFPDLADQTRVIRIEDNNTSVVAALEKRVPEIEKLHAERLLQLAQRYSKEEKDRLLVN